MDLQDFLKENDVILHQIYHLMQAYWYGTEDAENGSVELTQSYDEWATDWYYEITQYNDFKPSILTDTLEEYKKRTVEEKSGGRKMRDFGGAYDIDPAQYWTKDDLMELKDAIEEINPDLPITEIYLREDDSLDITYEDRHGNEWHLEKHIIIDHEKAGTCRAMCKMYAPIAADTMAKELKAFEAELEAEQEEEWMDY